MAKPSDLSVDNLTLRDHFAISAPEPSVERIKSVAESERLANPHNDSYKPRRRSWAEIACALRYEWADMMIKVRELKS